MSLFCLSSSPFASEFTSPPKRIVSLAPSMTEILFALQLGDNIVGVTNFCDYPEEAKAKPKIGMSNPSLEAIVSQTPDLVVMTTDGNPKEVEERLRSLKIRTYVWKARTLRELPGGIRELGAAVGVQAKAEALSKEVETALNRFGVSSENSKLKTRNSKPKKILFIVWPEPLIVAGPGTAIDDSIKLLGHENIASDARAAYPKYSIVSHQCKQSAWSY